MNRELEGPPGHTTVKQGWWAKLSDGAKATWGVGLLSAIITLVLFIWTQSSTTDPGPLLSAGKILSPTNGAQISQAIEARGTAANIPGNHQLWLFLARTDSERWLRGNGVWGGLEQSYLQINDGYWNQGDLEFGAKEDPPGIEFELALVDLGPAGINRMRTYGQDGDGIPRAEVLGYPDTRLLHSIRVYRK